MKFFGWQEWKPKFKNGRGRLWLTWPEMLIEMLAMMIVPESICTLALDLLIGKLMETEKVFESYLICYQTHKFHTFGPKKCLHIFVSSLNCWRDCVLSSPVILDPHFGSRWSGTGSWQKNFLGEILRSSTYTKTNFLGTMVSLAELKNWFSDHFMGSPWWGIPLTTMMIMCTPVLMANR